MKPYYSDKWVTIYHGDCREILSELWVPNLLTTVDLLLTDPPYKGFNKDHHRDWEILDIDELFLLFLPTIRQFIFWSVLDNFPLDYSAVHIWWKRNSQSAHRYERIFERNGKGIYKVFDSRVVTSPVTAKFAQDTFYNHPTQKPESLIREILEYASFAGDLILDPFLGSGTTCYCAKKLNRYSIGIEIEEKYCEIAAKRCCQDVMELV